MLEPVLICLCLRARSYFLSDAFLQVYVDATSALDEKLKHVQTEHEANLNPKIYFRLPRPSDVWMDFYRKLLQPDYNIQSAFNNRKRARQHGPIGNKSAHQKQVCQHFKIGTDKVQVV